MRLGRRAFLRRALDLALAGVPLLGAASCAARGAYTGRRASSSRRPSVLVFFTDQQRWDSCGCYGNPMGLTPNLDAMADRGTRLERCFTVQPVCGPARSCIMSGRYATETGCYRNDIPLPEGIPTLARGFGAGGWFTGYIGKWHLGGAKCEGHTLGKQEPVPPARRVVEPSSW